MQNCHGKIYPRITSNFCGYLNSSNKKVFFWTVGENLTKILFNIIRLLCWFCTEIFFFLHRYQIFLYWNQICFALKPNMFCTETKYVLHWNQMFCTETKYFLHWNQIIFELKPNMFLHWNQICFALKPNNFCTETQYFLHRNQIIFALKPNNFCTEAK